MMKLIACVDENWGIGKDNELLCKIPEDLKRFKEITTDGIVIMGRKTYESIGKLLSNRTNIILTSDEKYTVEGAYIFNSIEKLISSDIIKDNISKNNIFVIGGESIYKQLLMYCDYAYITKVCKNYEADAHMVNLDEDKCWMARRASLNIRYKDLTYGFAEYKRMRY